jgi:hypothetical protein
MHGVDITETSVVKEGRRLYRRTYNTPMGSVYTEEIREPGVGQWHGNRSWRDVTPWKTKRLIREPRDYAVVKYIVENTRYEPDYFPIEQAQDWLGEDGVVLARIPHSPMQTLMIDWVGSEEGRIFFHLADHLDLVEDLYEALCRSREPLYRICAESPAPIVLCGDNLDGFLVSPSLFEKYFLPVYERQAEILHAHERLMAVHMDGRIASLKGLIARSHLDIIEALHPPPMGDLSIHEALEAFPGKAIWIGFPGSIYAEGPKTTEGYARSLLSDFGTGERVVVTMSTENIVSNQNLMALTAVLEGAELPLEGPTKNQG